MIMLTETVTHTCVANDLADTLLGSFDLLKETYTWDELRRGTGGYPLINFFPDVWLEIVNNGEAELTLEVGLDNLDGDWATQVAAMLFDLNQPTQNAAADNVAVAHSGGKMAVAVLPSCNATVAPAKILSPRINIYGTATAIDPTPIEGHTIVVTCFMSG